MQWTQRIRSDCEIWFQDKKFLGSDFCALVSTWKQKISKATDGRVSGSKILALKENNDLDTLAILFAAQSLDMCVLLLAKSLTEQEDTYLLRRSCADMYLTQSQQFESLKPLKNLSEYVSEGGVLFQSSGSTGKPKIIFQPWAQLEINAQLGAQTQKLGPNSRSLCALSLCHTGGLNVQLLPCLLNGGSICLSSLRTGDYFKKIDAFRPTNTVLVPNQLDMYASSLSRLPAKTFRGIASGSTPVLKKHWDLLNHLGERAVSVYGLTESGPYALVTDRYVEPPVGAVSFLGTPVPGYSIKVNSATQEISLMGPTVAAYWPRPKAEGWFNTQDLGVENEHGVFFVGRQNRSFKSFGRIVNPESVEAALLQFKDISDVRVMPYQHKTHGLLIHALIVGDRAQLGLLKKWLKTHLARNLWPRKFTFLKELPKTLIHKTLPPPKIEGDAS